MNNPDNYPLQTYLQSLLQNFEQILQQQGAGDIQRLLVQMNARTGRAAQLFLGALPVMMIYPFLQKYFTKGLVMGSVKDKSIKEQNKRSQRSKVMKQIEVSTYGIFPEDCREIHGS